MVYFPIYLKLDNKKILIVGGGKIAAHKINKLLDFTKDITIIAPHIIPKTMQLIQTNSLQVFKRRYKKGDIDTFNIVIVAVDDIEVQKEVYAECRQKGILCNSVDSMEYCDFIFPSYTKKGALTIAYSTSGTSPSFAKYLRCAIERLLPDSIVEFLSNMQRLRQELPKGKERMELLDKRAKEYIDQHFN